MATKNKKIKIELTLKQFHDLLLLVSLGTFMKEGVDEVTGEDFRKTRRILNSLYRLAYKNGLDNLVEKIEDYFFPTTALEQEEEVIIDTFIEDSFWETLVTYLGRRDFFRFLSNEKRINLAKTRWLPECIRPFYREWEEEFAKHGLDRLGIIPDSDLNNEEEDKDTK